LGPRGTNKIRDHLDLPPGEVPACEDGHVLVLGRAGVRHSEGTIGAKRESVGTSDGQLPPYLPPKLCVGLNIARPLNDLYWL